MLLTYWLSLIISPDTSGFVLLCLQICWAWYPSSRCRGEAHVNMTDTCMEVKHEIRGEFSKLYDPLFPSVVLKRFDVWRFLPFWVADFILCTSGGPTLAKQHLHFHSFLSSVYPFWNLVFPFFLIFSSLLSCILYLILCKSCQNKMRDSRLKIRLPILN